MISISILLLFFFRMHCILHFAAMRLTNPGIFFTSLVFKPRLSQIDYIPALIECPLPADFPLPTIVSISAAPCGAAPTTTRTTNTTRPTTRRRSSAGEHDAGNPQARLPGLAPDPVSGAAPPTPTTIITFASRLSPAKNQRNWWFPSPR